jgi:HD-GYP domain-containing protein (c-di-GMP phosphodiesterase class II)
MPDTDGIRAFELVFALSEAVDLVSPQVSNHHHRTAAIASMLAEEAGLPPDKHDNLLMAAAVHDAGALTLREKLDIMNFEKAPEQHAELGARLLAEFAPFSKTADIVRWHHSRYRDAARYGGVIPFESRLLTLADRIAVLLGEKRGILNRAPEITEKIRAASGSMFDPKAVDVFMSAQAKEMFWLDAVHAGAQHPPHPRNLQAAVQLDSDSILEIGKLFSHAIDFRSPFTATHSTGVAACAQQLAKYARFKPEELRLMRLAGYLHDLGKLAVPNTILIKPGPLTREEFGIMRTHPYYTFRTLEHIPALHTVNLWASCHHEKVNGKGYPFHLKGKQMSTGALLMAAADIFTAITEDRPYRNAMEKTTAMSIIKQLAANGSLDKNAATLVTANFDELSQVREKEQTQARKRYDYTVKCEGDD